METKGYKRSKLFDPLFDFLFGCCISLCIILMIEVENYFTLSRFGILRFILILASLFLTAVAYNIISGQLTRWSGYERSRTVKMENFVGMLIFAVVQISTMFLMLGIYYFIRGHLLI